MKYISYAESLRELKKAWNIWTFGGLVEEEYDEVKEAVAFSVLEALTVASLLDCQFESVACVLGQCGCERICSDWVATSFELKSAEQKRWR